MRRLFAFFLTMAVPLVAGCEGFPDMGSTSRPDAERDSDRGGVGVARSAAPVERVMLNVDPIADATFDVVRAAATEFVEVHLPWWEIRGVTALGITVSVVLVGVDIKAVGQRQTLNLIVRRFTADDATKYWRAEILTAELGQILTGYALQRQRVLTEPLTEQ